MITNIPAPDHLDKLLCHLQCFFKDQRKKDRRVFEPDTRLIFPCTNGRIVQFSKDSSVTLAVNTYSALSFGQINFKICL